MQDFWCEVKVLLITMSNSCHLWFCWQLAGERQTPPAHFITDTDLLRVTRQFWGKNQEQKLRAMGIPKQMVTPGAEVQRAPRIMIQRQVISGEH